VRLTILLFRVDIVLGKMMFCTQFNNTRVMN